MAIMRPIGGLKTWRPWPAIAEPAITGFPLAELQFKFSNRQTMAPYTCCPTVLLRNFSICGSLKSIEQQFVTRINALKPSQAPSTLP